MMNNPIYTREGLVNEEILATLSIKSMVFISGMKEEILYAIDIFRYCAKDMGIDKIRLSSGRYGDFGIHGNYSHHYKGLAADIGAKEFSTEAKHTLLSKVKEVLGEDYQVLLENEGNAQEHFHVEYDPKQL